MEKLDAETQIRSFARRWCEENPRQEYSRLHATRCYGDLKYYRRDLMNLQSGEDMEALVPKWIEEEMSKMTRL